MNRRGFLASILAAGVAPAVLSSGVIMRIAPLIVPPSSGLTIAKLLAARDLLNAAEVPAVGRVHYMSEKQYAHLMDSLDRAQFDMSTYGEAKIFLPTPAPLTVHYSSNLSPS